MKYSACCECGTTKNLSPRRALHLWPTKHQAGVLSTELQELMVSKAILLGSYASGSCMMIKRKGGKFFKSLVNKMWKMKYSACRKHGTKKKSKSPKGIEPMTSQSLGGYSIQWNELMVSKAIFFSFLNVYFNREKKNTHKCRTNIPI